MSSSLPTLRSMGLAWIGIGTLAVLAFLLWREDAPPAVVDTPAPRTAEAARADDDVESATAAETPSPTRTVAPADDAQDGPRVAARGRVLERTARGLVPVTAGSVSLRRNPPPMMLRAALARQPQVDGNDDLLATAPIGAGGAYTLEAASFAGFLRIDDPLLTCESLVRIDGADAALPDLIVVAAGRIQGRVVDAEGNGLGDIAIQVGPTPDPRNEIQNLLLTGSKRGEFRCKSAADGAFDVPSVPSGAQWTIKATSDAYAPFEVTTAIAAGETKTLELRLTRGAFLTGRVIGGGKPVAGARVDVRSTALKLEGGSLGSPPRSERTTTTAADGTFRFDGMLPGRIRLDVHSDAFAPGNVSGFDLALPGLALPSDVVLEDGPRIRGRVLDDIGAPVAQARVGFLKPIPFVQSEQVFSPDVALDMGGVVTSTNAEGWFESPPLPSSAPLDVIANSKDHAIGGAHGVKAGSSDATVRVSRFGSCSGLVESATDGEPMRRFSATVAPAENASVFAVPNASDPQPVLFVHSDDGAFEFDRLKPGSYRVDVVADGFARGSSTTFAIEPGKRTAGILVRLVRESTIRGVVVDGATGNPIEGARVGRSRSVVGMQFDPLLHHQSATTDAAGQFVLRGLAAGSITLAAHADRYAPASSTPIALAEGEARDGVKLTLVRGATIHGFVGSKDGEPEVGALVTCQQLGSFVPSTTTADSAGQYRIEGLAAGSYTVTKLGAVVDQGGENAMNAMFSNMATRSARVNAGEEATVDFISGSRTGPALTGRVTEGGEPLSGAFLTFTPDEVEAPTDAPSGLGAMRLVSTDKDGMFRIEGLAAGDWSVTVQSGTSLSDTARQTFEFTLSSLPEQRQDFALQATGIEGIVRSKTGKQPQKGVRVRIDATDAHTTVDAFVGATGSRRVADLFTDTDGHYVARGLAAGRYRVSAGGPGFFGIGGTGFAASAPLDVDVKDGQRTSGVDFDLEPGGAVRGTVTKPDGGPCAGASIFVVDANASAEPFAQMMTEAEGTFEVSGLAAGTHVVIARATGYAPAIEHGVRVHAEEKTDVSLRLTHGANLTVVVTDAAGTTLSGAKVTLTDPSGIALNQYLGLDEIMKKLGGSSTEHDLGELAAGDYTLVVSKDGKSATTAVHHGGDAQTVTVALP
jgi:uncharacterized GH25 family protein